MKYLDKIKSPADVKNLNEDDLPLWRRKSERFS